MSAEILRELARAKAVFQLRAIEAIVNAPASAIEARRVEPVCAVSIEDESAAPLGETPNPRHPSGDSHA